MKIIIVMDGFFPGKRFGGPPVSIDNFCSLLKEDDIYIITRDHDLYDSQKYKGINKGWNDRGNCKVLYLSDDRFNKNTFNKIIIDIVPDIIYLQGLFQPCIIPCLYIAKRHCIPVLLAPRGELCSGALKIKKYKKIPYLSFLRFVGLTRSIYWQSTSEEESKAIVRVMKSSEKNVFRLDNIPSIPQIEYTKKDKVTGKGRFIFLSRIHPKKNLLNAIKIFNNVKGKAVFDIYGPVEDKEYWEKCNEEITKLPSNIEVRYMGLVEHSQVHKLFSQYDAFLFPTLSENYGHVIAESLIVGTPVIISDQTPWNDINNNGAGWAIPLSNINGFVSAVESIIEINSIDYSDMVKCTLHYCKDVLKIEIIKNEYKKALITICESKRRK